MINRDLSHDNDDHVKYHLTVNTGVCEVGFLLLFLFINPIDKM